MGTRVLFSAWLRSQVERADMLGEVARAWNAQPFAARKGRINAARIDRQLQCAPGTGEQVIKAYEEAHPKS